MIEEPGFFMNKAQALMNALIEAAEELNLADGFTTGGVSYSINTTGDVMTFTAVIPCTLTRDPDTGGLTYVAKNSLVAPAP